MAVLADRAEEIDGKGSVIGIFQTIAGVRGSAGNQGTSMRVETLAATTDSRRNGRSISRPASQSSIRSP